MKYDDENKALVLLHSLPRSYETFADILKHDRDTLTLEVVIGALNSKDLRSKVEGKSSTRDVLTVRSKSFKKDPRGRGKSRLRSRVGKNPIKCYYHYHDEGHIKRHGPKKKKDFLDKENVDGGVNVCEIGYDSVDALLVLEKN